MQEIILNQGQGVLVDADIYDYLSIWSWTYANGYARRSIRDYHGDLLLMHRVILNAPEGMIVDHINGNKLDNRAVNLRLCTTAENVWNRGKNANNTSGYKGVSRQMGRWIATIGVNGRYIKLGRFKNILDAARAYNKAAIEHHGEFAYQNPL